MGEKGLEDPIGYKMTLDDAGGARKNKTQHNALLDKKAWDTASSPIHQVGMNLFMLWMSGSSPGIFNVMILGYCLTSIFGQFSRMSAAFAPFKTIDTTFHKLAYFALCTVSLAYMLYHASGMGLLPMSSGDWIAYIPNVEIQEVASGVLK